MMILRSVLRPLPSLVLMTAVLACGQATVAAPPHAPTEGASSSPGAVSEQENLGLLHLDHLALMVSNLERSVEFYAKVLQLPETFDATEKDHIRWFSLGGDRQLHIIATDSFEGVLGKGVHFALTTSDFEQIVARLVETQIPFESWPGTKGESNLRPDGVKQVYLQDPDGYWIEINDASTKWPTRKNL